MGYSGIFRPGFQRESWGYRGGAHRRYRTVGFNIEHFAPLFAELLQRIEYTCPQKCWDLAAFLCGKVKIARLRVEAKSFISFTSNRLPLRSGAVILQHVLVSVFWTGEAEAWSAAPAGKAQICADQCSVRMSPRRPQTLSRSLQSLNATREPCKCK